MHKDLHYNLNKKNTLKFVHFKKHYFLYIFQMSCIKRNRRKYKKIHILYPIKCLLNHNKEVSNLIYCQIL